MLCLSPLSRVVPAILPLSTLRRTDLGLSTRRPRRRQIRDDKRQRGLTRTTPPPLLEIELVSSLALSSGKGKKERAKV